MSIEWDDSTKVTVCRLIFLSDVPLFHPIPSVEPPDGDIRSSQLFDGTVQDRNLRLNLVISCTTISTTT